MTLARQRSDESNNTRRLVQRCLHGDEQAWQDLVQQYAPLVHSIPVRYGIAPQEVDDIGQEVFLALAQNLHQIEEPDCLPAWLITTARRICWRVIRKAKQEEPSGKDDLAELTVLSKASQLSQPIPNLNELLSGWQRQEAIQQGLDQLEPRCRDLLVSVFLDPNEPSYEEISSQLDLPKGSIGPMRSRCLQKLRDALEKLGFDLVASTDL